MSDIDNDTIDTNNTDGVDTNTVVTKSEEVSTEKVEKPKRRRGRPRKPVDPNQVKRSRGRPPKTSADDPKAIQAKIVEEQDKFGARCADNLQRLFGNMFDAALTDIKGLGYKDKMIATKYCIEYAQKYLEESEERETGGKGKQEPEKPAAPAQLISLNAVK